MRSQAPCLTLVSHWRPPGLSIAHVRGAHLKGISLERGAVICYRPTGRWGCCPSAWSPATLLIFTLPVSFLVLHSYPFSKARFRSLLLSLSLLLQPVAISKGPCSMREDRDPCISSETLHWLLYQYQSILLCLNH